MSNELITQIDTQALIRQRDLALDTAMRGMAMLAQARDIAGQVGVAHGIHEALKEHFCWKTSPLDTREFSQLEANMRRKLDASAWDEFVRATGLHSFMDDRTRKQWDQAFKTNQYPVFDLSTAEATVETLKEKRYDMLDDNILDIYRGMSWDNARAVPLPVHSKAKLMGFTCPYYDSLGHGSDRFKDLVRILMMLDGKRPDLAKISNDVLDAFHKTRGDTRQFENDYLTVRYYKNGKADLTFKRQDLMDKLNDRVMGRAQALLDKAA